MSDLVLSLLGPVLVTLAGQPIKFRTKKTEALLIYLVTETSQQPDLAPRRETLLALLWPDYPEASARHSLRTNLYYLKKLIPDVKNEPDGEPAPFLLSDNQSVQINPAVDYELDVPTFTRLLAQNRVHDHLDLLTCAECAERLQQAVDLYRGDFLVDFYLPDSGAFEDWVAGKREELRGQALGALETLTAVYGERGAYDQAEAAARRQLKLDNLRESAHRQLMTVLARSGRRRAALSQYELCCQLLLDELGVEPSAETQLLYGAITAGELDKRAEAKQSRVETAPALTRSSPSTLARLPAFLEVGSEAAEVEGNVFVARERELAQLDAHLEEALSGHGRVVFITGEAGQGKTTLLVEFARRALAADPELIVAGGNCDAYAGAGDPYLPFREVMGMLGGDVEARLAARTINRDHAQRLWRLIPDTAQALAQDGPDLVDVFISGPALVDRVAIGQVGRPAWLRQLNKLAGSGRVTRVNLEQGYLFEQYARVLRDLASDRPLLITLDDLQWADKGSISLLFHLGRRLEGTRILLVGAYRPDEVALGRDGERHPLEKVLGEFKRAFGDVWLDLAEAERVEGRVFVDVLLDSEPNCLDEAFRQVLFDLTRGHPLFTVELLRTMQERGDLVHDAEGRWVEEPVLNWERLPARVEGAIEERVGRLAPELHELLSTASVEGEEFTAEVLARVLGTDQRQLLRQLSQDLEKRHRLVQERGAISVGRRLLSRFRFGHLLFQHYFYNELGDGQRRRLHLEVAQVLEALYEGQTDEKASQLAYHFLRARKREKAIEYSRLAAQRAKAVYAYDEAIQQLQTALDLLGTDEQADTRMELLEELADVHSVFTTDTQAISYYQAALEMWSSLTGADNMIAVRLHRKILEFAFQLHGNVALEFFDPLFQTLAPSRAYLEARLPLALSEQSQLEWVRVLVALANFTDTGIRSPEDLDTAEGYAQAAVDLAEQLDAPEELSDALETLGGIYFVRGLLPEQLRVSRRRLALSQDPRFSDLRKRSHILESLCDALIAVGEYEQALPFLLELGKLTIQIGAIADHIWSLGLQALCLFRLDRWEELFSLEEKRRELERRYSSVQLGGGNCVILSLSAAAQALQGNLDQARVQRELALEIMLGGAEGPPDSWGRSEFY